MHLKSFCLDVGNREDGNASRTSKRLLLIGLRGFIDRFWQNKFPPKSRYGVQTRLRAEQAIGFQSAKVFAANMAARLALVLQINPKLRTFSKYFPGLYLRQDKNITQCLVYFVITI